VGDPVAVFDASGAQFRARVVSVSSQSATLALEQRLEPVRKPTREVTVAISPIRPDAMSWLVQKLTELGVARLSPFVSERTALPKAADAESDEARRRRWERISLAACKQCGRSTPLQILPTRAYGDLLSSMSGFAGVGLFAWEGGDARPMAEVMRGSEGRDVRPVVVVIGPEGGFTRDEYDAAVAAGMVPVDLGAYILRAETAAIVAAAVALSG